MRIAYLVSGFTFLALGAIGVAVPLLPTVPFMLLAAFCFARSSPALERRLLEHRRIGPHIRDWRARGAIGKGGKRTALVAFSLSAILSVLLLPLRWAVVPLAVAAIGSIWILKRPDA
ncbi:MAG: YbaN family protein [Parasphingopyxis sp.]|nr:YbaN family protein [Sphingomonadales bacterium]